MSYEEYMNDMMAPNNPIPVGKVVKVKEFCFINPHGGTGMSNCDFDPRFLGVAEVKITKSWFDYECGFRAVGKAVSKNLKDYLKANANAKDKRVFVSEFEVVK